MGYTITKHLKKKNKMWHHEQQEQQMISAMMPAKAADTGISRSLISTPAIRLKRLETTVGLTTHVNVFILEICRS